MSAFSIGVVTVRSTSTGDKPVALVSTDTCTGETSGSASIGKVLAAHTPTARDYPPATNPSISRRGGGEDDAELRGYWEKLSGSGTVTVPLEVAPWGDSFGMCNDKFGITWLVNIAGPQQAGER